MNLTSNKAVSKDQKLRLDAVRNKVFDEVIDMTESLRDNVTAVRTMQLGDLYEVRYVVRHKRGSGSDWSVGWGRELTAVVRLKKIDTHSVTFHIYCSTAGDWPDDSPWWVNLDAYSWTNHDRHFRILDVAPATLENVPIYLAMPCWGQEMDEPENKAYFENILKQ